MKDLVNILTEELADSFCSLCCKTTIAAAPACLPVDDNTSPLSKSTAGNGGGGGVVAILAMRISEVGSCSFMVY